MESWLPQRPGGRRNEGRRERTSPIEVMRAGKRYAILWLRPLKKKRGGLAHKLPQYIAEFDGGKSDAYAALRRLVEFDPVEPTVAGLTPLFRDFRRERRRTALHSGHYACPHPRKDACVRIRGNNRVGAASEGLQIWWPQGSPHHCSFRLRGDALAT